MKPNRPSDSKKSINPQDFSLKTIPTRTFRALIRHIKDPAYRERLQILYTNAKLGRKIE